ncbi:hypothetical protein V5O48_019490, partial [Marasmius crinis-equi]
MAPRTPRRNPYPPTSSLGLATPPRTPTHSYNLRQQYAPSPFLQPATSCSPRRSLEARLPTPDHIPSEKPKRSEPRAGERKLREQIKVLQKFREIAKLAKRVQTLKDKSDAHQTYVDRQTSQLTCTLCNKLFASPQT